MLVKQKMQAKYKCIAGLQAYLLERIKVNEQTGCWEWQSSIERRAYGQTKHGKAHRASYEAFIGPIGQCETGRTLSVCHTCDTPYCINPEHLFLGTQADNAADMYAKGRDNCKGRIVPKETRQRISESLTGKHASDETRLKLSKAKAGIANPNFGKKHSEATRAKISIAKLGKQLSQEHKARLSKALTGESSPLFGKQMPKSVKSKISEANKRRTICPHCDKTGGVAIMRRWHFDNCKHKVIIK